ncbi:MAG: hypothetical protein AAFN13_04895 [Bacteroidota bacterium]
MPRSLIVVFALLVGATLAGTTLPPDSQIARHLAQPDTTAFADRQAILATIEAFYIGDHTGRLDQKLASMHSRGAYRYVDRDGAYQESPFQLVESRGDTLYTEELLGVDIYENAALARLRLENQRREEAEYKLMTLHKTSDGWLITSIVWGWGVTP